MRLERRRRGIIYAKIEIIFTIHDTIAGFVCVPSHSDRAYTQTHTRAMHVAVTMRFSGHAIITYHIASWISCPNARLYAIPH